MIKTELQQLLIIKFGVYPPDNATYDEMVRLRKMLNKYAKPKKSFGQAKKSDDDVPKFDPPPFEFFKVEEESSKNLVSNTYTHLPIELTPSSNDFMTNLSIVNIQTPRILGFSEYPLSDEDGSESPTTSSKRVLSWSEEYLLKRTKTE
jgi:hypothetical protein